MKEFVGEEQESDDHGEVEELTEDEASKVDVVSVKQSIRLDSDNSNLTCCECSWRKIQSASTSSPQHPQHF